MIAAILITAQGYNAQKNLTNGKLYMVECSDEYINSYQLKADDGHQRHMPKYRFKLLSKHRSEIIDKILE